MATAAALRVRCSSPLIKICDINRIFEGRKIALVVLSTPQWPVVRLNLEKIAVAVSTATPGSYTEVELLNPRV